MIKIERNDAFSLRRTLANFFTVLEHGLEDHTPRDVSAWQDECGRLIELLIVAQRQSEKLSEKDTSQC